MPNQYTRELPAIILYLLLQLSRSAPVIFLVLAAIIAGGRVAGFGFTDEEDVGNITENHNVNPPTLAGLHHIWTQPYLNLYIPLTYTAWWLLAQVSRTGAADEFGTTLNPWNFHSVNLLLHITTALLVLSILRTRLRFRDGPALVGALIFAIHPIQVEAFAWTSGMKDVLSGALGMAAIDQYLAAFTLRLSPRGSRLRYALATCLFCLATLAKPSIVVAPVIVGLIDWLILQRNWKSVGRALAPWFVLGLPILIVTRLVQRATEVANQPLWTRPLIAGDTLAFYLGKLVWPFNMTNFYARSPRMIMQSGELFWTWTVPAIVAVIIALSRRRAVICGALMFVAGVLPVLGFTRFTFQQFSTAADRYVYMSMLGIALIVADLMSIRFNRRIAIGAAVVLVLLGLRTFDQAGTWSDALTLYQHGAAVAPNSAVAQANCAAVLIQNSRSAEAVPHAARAVELAPDNRGYRRTYAWVLDDQHRWRETAEQLEIMMQREAQPETAKWLASVREELTAEGSRSAATTTSPTTSSAPPPASMRP